ncbi:bacterial alpha-L-rhamnosidase domain protein [Mollisia scopiformis]|uniref:Bacterial alpha-L-rhamnosidase domain protein n=1 Tax=Mollisia scopiformis TaxID=149040 RepID=A0A194XKP8_MOLSC|nr:bacterial alpha-L-rhamnosidase domain protein [Mollisia scopiformis]KUJ20790.1 bacterial alpha-L-rhamnosidase domain protein [Mollisia scopiformis]
MYILFSFLSLLLAAHLTTAIPYSKYILAPSNRTLHPASIHRINGTITNASSLLSNSSTTGHATFHPNSSITFDYLQNIAGVVSVTVLSSTSPDAFIGLTYTESSLWINKQASDATAPAGLDEVLWLPVGKGPGTYTVERWHERGAFRYLTLVNNGSASVVVESVVTNFTAAPLQDLRDYKGYFHCDDELLNRIWYAGAYTNQLCNIDPYHGDAQVHFGDITFNETINLPQTNTWYNNITITQGGSCTVDGAKRDRLVWAGDMAVSMPSIFVSTNDLGAVKNSLDSLLALQNASTGMFPYAGYPFNEFGIVSFTYHLYTLIAVSNYYHFSGDLEYLQNNWGRFTRGLAWSLSYIDDTGLMNVTAPADWLRVGMGGHNIEANAILYSTLTRGITLATLLNDTTSISTWTPLATKLKTAANALLWSPTTTLYHDNETTTLSPQDGNTWAILSNLTLSSQQNSQISTALSTRWGPYGAPAPEAGSPVTISPFISSFELEAHFLSSNPLAALELMRRSWGFMLTDPRMTNSTFIEGFSADGTLKYAPYSNDASVSHAHGWGTGPTSFLSFYVAGIRILGAGGGEWRVEPLVGDLGVVEAGFWTGKGWFESRVQARNGMVVGMEVCAPAGTRGSVRLLGVVGLLRSEKGEEVTLVDGLAEGLGGGNWTLVLA